MYVCVRVWREREREREMGVFFLAYDFVFVKSRERAGLVEFQSVFFLSFFVSSLSQHAHGCGRDGPKKDLHTLVLPFLTGSRAACSRRRPAPCGTFRICCWRKMNEWMDGWEKRVSEGGGGACASLSLSLSLHLSFSFTCGSLGTPCTRQTRPGRSPGRS